MTFSPVSTAVQESAKHILYFIYFFLYLIAILLLKRIAIHIESAVKYGNIEWGSVR